MRYFFDNCLSPKYAAILSSLGEDVVHLRDFMDGNTPDEVWIEYVARREWIAVTFDRRILKTPQLAHAFQTHGAVGLFLPSKLENMRLFEQATWLCDNWEKIRDYKRRNDSRIHVVKENGRILTWAEHQARRRKK